MGGHHSPPHHRWGRYRHWLAARTLPAARAWLVGLGAYLVASVLHALNDGVLGFYITNGLFAGLSILVLGVVIFFIWYRPQVQRLRDSLVTDAPLSAGVRGE